MASLLKYRIPGKEVVTKTGSFEPLNSFDSFQGFIVSDFEGKELYRFSENPSDIEMSLSKQTPFCISKEDYLTSAQEFLKEIRAEEMGKAVFSRVKCVDFDSQKVFDLFDGLVKKYPETLVYLISSPDFGTWLGATPEKLIESNGDQFYTMSLAGTLPALSDKDWTSKEKDEQMQVTDFILDKIQTFGAQKIQLNGPNEVVAGAVKHLRTEIQFRLDQSKSLTLAKDLHPTPAVSGMPREKSLELIKSHEKHERRLYAGMIGLVDADECRLFVNLRCCEIQNTTAYLYIGGGFTKDSDIEQEWIETENKSLTLLNLIDQIS